MKYLDRIDDKAIAIGAVNTVINVNGKLIGYNTDVDGFVESFHLRNIDLKNKSVAVFGTGGAAKAIIIGLLFEKVKEIDIFSRKLLKSKAFIDEINIEKKLIIWYILNARELIKCAV